MFYRAQIVINLSLLAEIAGYLKTTPETRCCPVQFNSSMSEI